MLKIVLGKTTSYSQRVSHLLSVLLSIIQSKANLNYNEWTSSYDRKKQSVFHTTSPSPHFEKKKI